MAGHPDVAVNWRDIGDSGRRLRFAFIGNFADGELYEVMMRSAFVADGLDAEYLSLDTSAADFADCVRHLIAKGFLGANIGVPHKPAAARMAESFFIVRHGMATANALLFREGIYGQNTEVAAVNTLLRDVEPGTALILGGGSAARSVIAALLETGWRVKLWNRGAAKMRLLQTTLAKLGDVEISATPTPAGCRLIVNATSLGKRVGEQPSVEWQHVQKGAVAFDLVFREKRTEFLRAASLRGLRVIDGREMLVEQAAIAYEWWLQGEAPRTAMLRAVGLAGPRDKF